MLSGRGRLPCQMTWLRVRQGSRPGRAKAAASGCDPRGRYGRFGAVDLPPLCPPTADLLGSGEYGRRFWVRLFGFLFRGRRLGSDRPPISASATHEGLPGLSVGMFDGLAGLGLTACSLSRGGTRYQRFLAELDAALFPQVLRQAESLLNGSEGRSNGEFDAISGLAGVGIYLLRCRHPIGS